jgi:hypothetical protein
MSYRLVGLAEYVLLNLQKINATNVQLLKEEERLQKQQTPIALSSL